MPTLNELREDRVKLSKQAQALVDAAKGEKREMNAAENEQFEKIFGEVDALKLKIEDAEKSEARSARLDDEKRWQSTSAGTRVTPPTPGETAEKKASGQKRWNATPEYDAAFSSFLRVGDRGMSSEHRSRLEQPDELRALQADSQIVGGYIVAPQTFYERLILAVKNQVFMRGLATVISIQGSASLGAPSLDNDPADSDWTAEIATGGEDSTMSFGKRELRPKPLAKLLKVSRTLLQRASNAEALVRDRLAYKFGVTDEKAFLSGSGANQPLGVFTASANGISTARDMSTDNSTTAIAADGLINAKFSLKPQYMNSPATRWIFHRDAIRNIRKLKDGTGQYLWAPGLGGKPDTILDVPYVMSEYAPNTFTTGLYVGIIGDFSNYWIVDALDMQMQRLEELYAATNQVGFIGRLETDGMPVLEEAFARIKLA